MICSLKLPEFRNVCSLNLRSRFKPHGSTNFWQKLSASTYTIAIKNVSKNLSFGMDFKLQLPALTYKINALNISGIRSKAIILTDDM